MVTTSASDVRFDLSLQHYPQNFFWPGCSAILHLSLFKYINPILKHNNFERGGDAPRCTSDRPYEPFTFLKNTVQ